MPVGGIVNAAVSFLVGSASKVKFEQFLPKHRYYPHPAGKIFTGGEHQIVLSAILGDGSLGKPYARANHRIKWNMGHEEHAKYKLRMTEFLGTKYTQRDNPGFGSEWHCVLSSCSPVLSMYAEKYGDCKGLINGSGIAHELDDLGWAWYYGDDGHFDTKNGYCFLHTEGKNPEMVREIRDALKEFLGLDGVVVHRYIGGTKKREMECLRLRKNETIKFHEKISEHMAKGMEYKILPDIRNK